MGFSVGGGRMLDWRRVQSHIRSKSASIPEKKRAERDKPSSSNTSFDASQRIKLDMGRSNESAKDKSNQYHSITETSLKQEIDELETRLKDQVKIRSAFEKALGYGTASSYMLTESNDIPMPKPAIDLIKEIAVLEMEVIHLEQYLLSLYRKASDQQISSVSPNTKKEKPKCHPPVTIPEEDETTRSCSRLISLAEHLGTRISDHVPETPNKLSEEMVRCISEIYCKLSEPPSELHHHGHGHGLSSSDSSLSSPSDQYDDTSSSPGLGNNGGFSFHEKGEEKDLSGTFVEVLCIYKDDKKIEDLLQNFKSLIIRLEEVDPSKLKHEEKLAFWINVHNSLVMHAYLAYGFPHNNVQRVLLYEPFHRLKATYNVGRHAFSAEAIQSSILGVGCKMSHWLRLLFASKKFKGGDERLAYAIDHTEPLLHFALTSGSHSDPPVRVYTPKRIKQELETSKEEYIRMNLTIRNHKVQLPKLVKTFAKESGLCDAGLTEMINHSIPESSRSSLQSRKPIDWIPHSFTFRYLILREAAN